MMVLPVLMNAVFLLPMMNHSLLLTLEEKDMWHAKLLLTIVRTHQDCKSQGMKWVKIRDRLRVQEQMVFWEECVIYERDKR